MSVVNALLWWSTYFIFNEVFWSCLVWQTDIQLM